MGVTVAGGWRVEMWDKLITSMSNKFLTLHLGIKSTLNLRNVDS